MDVPIDKVYFSTEERARTDYGNLMELVKSLSEHGQLQDILVREFDPDEYPEADDNHELVVVDGGRRYAAFKVAERKDIEIPGMEKGHIGVKLKDDVDPVVALELEYRANEDRKDFDWKERAKLIRRLHEELSSRNDEWSQKDTANKLGITRKTVTVYLQLTSDQELFEDPRVQEADTFRTAHKQWKIARDKKRREKIVEHRNKLDELKASGALDEVSEEDVEAEALGGLSTNTEDSADLPLVTQDDCRHWLADIPDNHFDWIHWDPPYGADQAGGAFAAHKKIADDWESASQLMRESIPEVWRVLQPGNWLVIWCHPSRTNWLAQYLRGHVKDAGSSTCAHCGVTWMQENLTDPCWENGAWKFWVNPYPNIWYKRDRHSDGHEIRRFLTNQYETFLLAAKVQEKDDDPILVDSSVGNVFPHAMVSRGDRRHVMHKPAGLLKKILKVISISGSLGADPSAGSGSIIEAAIESKRKIRVCEADEEYAAICQETAENTVKKLAEAR